MDIYKLIIAFRAFYKSPSIFRPNEFRISVLVILFLLGGKTIAQICSPSSKPTPQMGGHIGPEFTNLWNMVNAGYGGNYGSANMGNRPEGHALVYLGPDGWPRADKEHTMMVNLGNDVNPNLKVEVGDLFHCQYKGTRSQLTLTSSDVTIENMNESGGMVTFDFKVLNMGRIYFRINGRITDIQIMRPGYELNDPRMVTDECKDYLRGLQVVRLMGQSGCNSNFEREWRYRTPANAPFENHVSNGDENNIRSNQDSPFDERANNPWLSNSFNQARSYPWEKAIDLCNYLEVDFYANVPVLADLNYMHELAKLVKSRLKPTLNLYVEIGNELWNFGGGGAFLGFGMLYSATHNLVKLQGDQAIVGNASKGIEVETGNFGNGTWWTGGSNAYLAVRRWQAYRLKQFMDEFAKEFGFADQGGVGVRIRAVLAGQRAYGWGGDYWFIGNEGVYFLNKQFGEGTAKKYLYGLAIASYVNVKDDLSKTEEQMTNLSVEEIIKQFNEDMNEQFGEFGQEGDCHTNPNGNCEGNELEDILAFAKRFGLKVIAYEGGPECNIQRGARWIPMKNIVAAYNSPLMYTHTKDYMNKWYSWMGYDALFIKNGFYTDEGYGAGYSVAEKLGDLSQQYRAYRDIMDSPAPALTRERGGVIGVDPVTTLMGNKVASYQPRQLKDTKFRVNTYFNAGNILSWSNAVYLLRNETSAKYKLTLEYNYGGGEGKKFEIVLNDKVVSTIELPYIYGGSNKFSQPILFDIPYGTHALVVRVPVTEKRDYGIDLIKLKFEIANENPPAMPDLIYGDLAVCKGNTKAKYEVSPIDFSVCEYEWSGLPASATILPKTTTNPITGQGTFKMYIDWGNTPNGIYDLQVVAKNQSKLPGNAWMESPPRKFKVTVQTCGFDIAPTPVCLNQNTTFTPSPMPDVVEYRWDLGVGANPNRSITKTAGDAVTAKYTSEGTIDVKLTTKNAAGDEKFYYNVVNVTSCNSPIVVSPVNYCKGATAEPLTATPANSGTDLKWYTSATGGTGSSTPPSPETNTTGTVSYWVTQMNNGGTVESDRSKIEVIVSEAPETPVLSTLPPYCKGATANVEDLTNKVTLTSGATAKWYTSNTATTSSNSPTVPNTTTVGNTSWFISQAIGTCESPKAELMVSVVEGPVFTVTSSDPLTCGNNGKITLKGLTPGATYKVSYNTIAPFDQTATTEGNIDLDLPSGNYNNIKVDNLSCSSTDAGTYTITDPTPPVFTVALRQPKICGALGAIVLKGLNNNTAYKVSYNNGAEQAFSSKADSIVMMLPKGSYSNIKVILGQCSKEDPGTYNLEEPEVIPPVALSSTFDFCQNQIVNISDITSRVQGDPAYKLRWYSAMDGTPANQPTISTTNSGPQSRWVSQANDAGCESEKVELKIQVNASTALTATGTDPTICGEPNGKILISGLRNVLNYKVEYKKEGQTQPTKNIYSDENGVLTLEGLGVGTYNSITVTPQSGSICLTKGAEEVTLKDPGSPAAPIISGAKDYCSGESIQPLSAATSSSGGSIEWYSDATLTNKIYTGSSYQPIITNGTINYYTIDIVAGCKSLPAIASISVIASPIPKQVSGSGGPASCNGSGYDLILAGSEVGVSYYIYKGDNIYNNTKVIGTGRDMVIGSVTEEGIYTVKAEAEGTAGCKADMTGSLTISPAVTPQTFEVQGGGSICEGSTENVDIMLSGSESGIEYILSMNSNPIATIQGTGTVLTYPIEAIAANSGDYTISAVNLQTGCSKEMSPNVTISVQSGASQPILSGNVEYCNQGISQIPAVVSEGSTQNWSISPETAGSIDNTGTVTWNSNFTGNVTISLKVSNTACPGTEKTATFETKTTSLPSVQMIKGDSIVCRGAVKQYQVFPVLSGLTYSWEISSNVSIQQKDDATGTITLLFNIDIPAEGVQISVRPLSEQCGLGVPQTKLVSKGDGCDIFVPNVLTPGSTDNTSIWAIDGINNFPKLNIQVFNRWGGKVYSYTGMYTKPWDGTSNGSPLPTATYYYVIDKQDGSDKLTGSITLLRE